MNKTKSFWLHLSVKYTEGICLKRAESKLKDNLEVAEKERGDFKRWWPMDRKSYLVELLLEPKMQRPHGILNQYKIVLFTELFVKLLK